LLTLSVEHPHGEGAITFEVFQEGGDTICGVFSLVGKLNLPPKAWLSTVRSTMDEFEQRMKAEGIAEMRVAGRDWSRVLRGYEPLEGKTPNLLRKRLI
jgi:hypothetical protein